MTELIIFLNVSYNTRNIFIKCIYKYSNIFINYCNLFKQKLHFLIFTSFFFVDHYSLDEQTQLHVRISRCGYKLCTNLMQVWSKTASKAKAFHTSFCISGFFINFNWLRYSETRANVSFSFLLASYFRCRIHVDTLKMRASEGTNYDRQLPRWNVTFANTLWFECTKSIGG